MDFQIPVLKDDVLADAHEHEGKTFEVGVNFKDLINAIIEFINKLIRFEF